MANMIHDRDLARLFHIFRALKRFQMACRKQLIEPRLATWFYFTIMNIAPKCGHGDFQIFSCFVGSKFLICKVVKELLIAHALIPKCILCHWLYVYIEQSFNENLFRFSVKK